MTNSIINKLFLVLLFTIFFVKYSIVIENQGVSINYLFFFFPIVTWLIKENFFVPPPEILLILLLYILIYFISVLFNINSNLKINSLFSFLIFINIFIFSFIKFNKDLINMFKISVVLISVLYSLDSVISLFSNTDPSINIKNITGSQRYGFILIFAFWTLFLSKTNDSFKTVKFILLAILIIGIILTFSRATIFSIILTFLIFIIFFMKKKNYIFQIKNIIYFFSFLCLSIIVISLNLEFFKLIYNFYLFSFLNIINFNSLVIEDPSTLQRLNIYYFIYNYIFNTNTNQMLFGSGFLGVWISSIDLVNSAHNQYLDVLFRTGVLGLLLYLLLLFRILIFLKKYDLSLFIGFVGVLVFGLFNETFKESQGSFLLSFLLGMYSSRGKKYFK
jgi:O-antigen ligase